MADRLRVAAQAPSSPPSSPSFPPGAAAAAAGHAKDPSPYPLAMDLDTPPSTPPLAGHSPRQATTFFQPPPPKAVVVVGRPLSANELSYYLPSRAQGVNDMYLHHRLTTSSPSLLSPPRVELIWALLRLRHPLLAASVVVGASGSPPRQPPPERWAFERVVPASVDDALDEAWQALSFVQGETDEELISRYLNGPRQLSSSHLSHLTLSTPPSSSAASSSAGGGEEGPTTFDLLLTTTHFVADGLALHQLANELYLLLGDRSLDLATLEGLVQAELADHRGRLTTPTPTPAPAGVADESGSEPCWLPLAAEDRLLRSLSRPSSASASTSAAATAAAAAAASGRAKVRRAIGKLVLRRAQAKGVGGQTFPRPRPDPASSSSSSSRATTAVPTRSFTPSQSARLLATCKRHNVTFASALFAIVNLAWARVRGAAGAGGGPMDLKEPMLFYSALNLRPSLGPSPPASRSSPSYVHLALGYYTVSLPSFPACTTGQFWLRAQAVKAQTASATRSAFLVERSLAECEERAARALKWARIDDDAAAAAAALVEQQQQQRGWQQKIAADATDDDEEEASSLAGLGIVGWRPPSTAGRIALAPTPSGGPRPLPPPPTTTTTLPTPPTSPKVPLSSPSSKNVTALPQPPPPPSSPPPAAPTSTPTNTPLMGLSLLGNLDFLYTHAAYPSLALTRLTTGSRQRPGAILLFGYSFKGQTSLSLGYDTRGFPAGVIASLWREMNDLTERLLVGGE